jgi:ubiquinone/menaquinone biosynthesis C-methylase UbiE
MADNAKRTYFNGLAAEWDNLPSMDDAPRKVRRYVRHSAAGAPRIILDAGCGTGILLGAILEECPGAALVVEADFAIEMLRQNARKLADPRVRRLCADVLSLPVPAGSFDLVLCFGILPHLPDARGALAEFLRVLKPGGVLSVGHLVGSRELNAFHGSLSGPVSGDFLPPSEALAHMLAEAGAVRVQAEENPDWYFVRAEKPACS